VHKNGEYYNPDKEMGILSRMYGTMAGSHSTDADGNCPTTGEQKLEYNFGNEK
jgi:hypothetical protein